LAIPHLLHRAAFWSPVMNASLLVLSLATAAAAPQDVLYDFYSTHCGPCQMMMPVVERLHAEGYPVVKINIDERPDLAQRFGVQYVPTFVLVIGGQERQRLTGWQEESTLRNMLAQIPQRAPAPRTQDRPSTGRRSVPVRLADDETKPKWDFHLPLPTFKSKKDDSGIVQIDSPSSGSSTAATSGTTLADAGNSGAAGRRPESPADSDASFNTGPDSVVRGAAPHSAGEPEAQPDPASVPLLASSARIRVTDEGGTFFGSGVVIDGTAGRSIVLTCGHILRDVKPESQIEVDLFEGKNFRTYKGTIVKFDLDADVGLVTLATTSNVSASPVAGPEDKVTRSQTLLSIGCSRGEVPSIERVQVTMLNRYEGPDTIECKGVPVKGRSGGGLFTANGRIVGVCTNADPQEGRGVYAGLKPIHKLLKTAGLEELIPGRSRPRSRPIDVAAATAPAAPADEPAATKVDPELAELKRAARRSAAQALAQEPAAQAEAEITAPMEDAEVICIIRPIHKGAGAVANSKVVIINRASRKFMRYLAGETNNNPSQPTMSQSEPAPTTMPEEPPAQPAQETVAARSAWKPTSSALSLSTR
jgi:thiol-disulfide isomerase/thioredoxin